jgi:hypothetical protein
VRWQILGLKFSIVSKDGQVNSFMANTPKEKEEWIRDLKNVLDAMERSAGSFSTELFKKIPSTTLIQLTV